MIIIFSAPSGSGKSTIVNYLLSKHPNLEFSVSATSRPPRGTEQNGIAYYFLSADEFRKKIAAKEFVEYEEVYDGCFYGTLKSEIERISSKGNHVIFDVDVIGGLNLKRIFGKKALAIFIAPPGLEELRRRLVGRGTDSPEMIEKRLAKAEQELAYAPQFDKIIVNDQLDAAEAEAERIVSAFISQAAQ